MIKLDNITTSDYENLGSFSEGMAKVEDRSKKIGYMDKTGKIIVPCQYYSGSYFSEGLALVELEFDNGEHIFIDKTGKHILEIHADALSSFSNGLASIGNVNRDKKSGDVGFRYGYINKQGEVVIPLKYLSTRFFREGMAAVELEYDKWAYIDTKGNEKIHFNYCGGYDRVYANIRPFSEGLVAIYDEDNKVGFRNKEGELVIPHKYCYASDFSEGLSSVRKSRHGRFEGYINTNGELVIPMEHSWCTAFHEGLAVVTDYYGLKKYNVINKNGEYLPTKNYEQIELFNERMAAVQDNKGRWGYIDTTGEEVIPCQYDYACPFSEGLASVTTKDGYDVIINKNGERVIDTKPTFMVTFSIDSDDIAIANNGIDKDKLIQKQIEYLKKHRDQVCEGIKLGLESKGPGLKRKK